MFGAVTTFTLVDPKAFYTSTGPIVEVITCLLGDVLSGSCGATLVFSGMGAGMSNQETSLKCTIDFPPA
jgi:hypothetical protein